MKIIDMFRFDGRNIFNHKPVVKMLVNLGEFSEIQTKDLGGFNERLINFFPGLNSHYCSLRHEGGFVQRLEDGTLLSHVTEHLAIELQCIMGYDVYFGKTRVIEEPFIYCIVYEYQNPVCATDFGHCAAEIVVALAKDEPIDIDAVLNRLSDITSKADLGPSTTAILEEAKHRQIPVRRLGEDSLLQLGYGKNMKLIEASLPSTTSSIAVDIAKNKQLSKRMLLDNRLPVPAGHTIVSEDEAVAAADQIGYPVVIKPLDGNQGKGVTVNIRDEISLRSAYHLAKSYSQQLIVEKHIPGKDYRVLVVGNHVAAVAERKPPAVIGDGVHSIMELVAEENKNPDRGIGHDKPLTKIFIDSAVEEFLASTGLNINDIPETGQVVYLRGNGNLSTGGIARDCTTEINPVTKELAVRAAGVIGLDVAGIDIVMDDISQALTSHNGAIVEVNAAPGLRMHLKPTEGQERNVAKDILDFMFPEGVPASIPVVSVTGTNGKTTVTRMIRHILSLTGKKVGMTCSSGSYIGEECISEGDNTGPLSARSILYNKDVELAVLETARGGIIRKGLGYDLADVGVIVNISEDHLGIDGVKSLEDLAFAKSLVIEAIKPTGYAVLNADDRMTESIADRVGCNLIFFSQNKHNRLVEQHISDGGTCVLLENGLVCVYQNHCQHIVMGVHEIPITFDGKALCNIENSLAAVASLVALDVPFYTIRLGLKSFQPDPIANAGRFNIFDMGDFTVLLDYGHNVSGYQSVIQFVNQLNAKRLVGVIGMPGDRLNTAIFKVGQMCGRAFSKLYIKEDRDLRGRQPGEVAGILYHGALNGGANPHDIETILLETAALDRAMQDACPGDLIVVFYESFKAVLKLVEAYPNISNQPIPLFPVKNQDLYSIPAVYVQ